MWKSIWNKIKKIWQIVAGAIVALTAVLIFNKVKSNKIDNIINDVQDAVDNGDIAVNNSTTNDPERDELIDRANETIRKNLEAIENAKKTLNNNSTINND